MLGSGGCCVASRAPSAAESMLQTGLVSRLGNGSTVLCAATSPPCHALCHVHSLIGVCVSVEVRHCASLIAGIGLRRQPAELVRCCHLGLVCGCSTPMVHVRLYAVHANMHARCDIVTLRTMLQFVLSMTGPVCGGRVDDIMSGTDPAARCR
jgi:hypothetical protein